MKRKKERERPRSWKAEKGTTNMEGWRMRETRDTMRDLTSFGDGIVSRTAMAASTATTYVSIIHCNAISLPSLSLSSPLLLLLLLRCVSIGSRSSIAKRMTLACRRGRINTDIHNLDPSLLNLLSWPLDSQPFAYYYYYYFLKFYSAPFT